MPGSIPWTGISLPDRPDPPGSQVLPLHPEGSAGGAAHPARAGPGARLRLLRPERQVGLHPDPAAGLFGACRHREHCGVSGSPGEKGETISALRSTEAGCMRALSTAFAATASVSLCSPGDAGNVHQVAGYQRTSHGLGAEADVRGRVSPGPQVGVTAVATWPYAGPGKRCCVELHFPPGICLCEGLGLLTR